MKNKVKIFLSMMILALITITACAPEMRPADPTPQPTSTPYIDPNDAIYDLNANARKILKRITETHPCEPGFVNIILDNVPDIFTLTHCRAACGTYFLVLGDKTEFILFIDSNGVITSISYWYPESQEMGPSVYTKELN